MKISDKLKIFIVDDDPFFRHLVEHDLKERGFQQIELFANGEDCVNNLDMMPDIIILDYEMEQLNGLDVLRRIIRFDPNILVLFLTAQKQLQVAIDSLKYGAFDYIEKSNHAMDMIVEKIESGHDLLVKSRKGKMLKRVKTMLSI